MLEILLIMVLVSIILSQAMPAMSTWVANARVRAVAESTQNAIRLASSEAMRRSRSTAFILTDSTPVVGATPTANGRRWLVQALIRRGSAEDNTAALFVQSGTEAAGMNVTVTGPSVLCFNPFGQQITLKGGENGVGDTCVAPNKTSTPTNYTFSHPQTTRRLRVQVGIGGEIRLCDPDKVLSPSNLDGCV